MNKEVLKKYGIDYAKGLARCMGNEQLYEKILSLFLQDTSFKRAKDALIKENQTELFQALHELKGASGNASLTDLYAAICPTVELLRGNTADTVMLKELFTPIEEAYNKAIDGIYISKAN